MAGLCKHTPSKTWRFELRRMTIEPDPPGQDSLSPESKRLFHVICSQTPDVEEIKSLMQTNVDQLKLAKQNGHPLLHEAVAQARTYQGARTILDIAFHDPFWNVLFDNPNHLGKYGDTVYKAMQETMAPKLGQIDSLLWSKWTEEKSKWKPIVRRPWE